MRLRVQEQGKSSTFEIDPEYNATIENVKILISLLNSDLDPSKQILQYKEKTLKDTMRLDQLGIQEDDLLHVRIGTSSGCCRIL